MRRRSRLGLALVLALAAGAAQAAAPDGADAAFARGAYQEAAAGYLSALEAAGDGRPLERAALLAALARAHVRFGDLDSAEAELAQALSAQAAAPPEARVPTYLARAELHRLRGRFDAAAADAEAALAAAGERGAHRAEALETLGTIRADQGRLPEAEDLHEEALALRRQRLGRAAPAVADSLSGLAYVRYLRGNYDSVEDLFRRALALYDAAGLSDHPNAAEAANNLGVLLEAQGRYGEVEPLHRRALETRERVFGPEHAKVADSLNNLAVLLVRLGRHDEAEALYRRGIAVAEASLGPDNPEVAYPLLNLGRLLHRRGRPGEALPLVERALTTLRASLGPDHPDVAHVLNNLAGLHYAMGDLKGAEALLAESLAIRERHLGEGHRDVAVAINNLAAVNRRLGNLDKAEGLVRRGLGIWEAALGPKHPEVAQGLKNLSATLAARAKSAEAKAVARRASGIWRERQLAFAAAPGPGRTYERDLAREAYAAHVDLLSRFAPPPEEIAEGFEIAQLAHFTKAAEAVAGMSARFAAGAGDLAAAIRERQDAARAWNALSEELTAAWARPAGERDAEAEAATRRRMGELERRIAALDEALSHRFPRYARLVAQQPVAATGVQALLRPGEALLNYMVADGWSVLWVIRPDAAHAYRLTIGRAELAEAVRDLRTGLADPTRADPADARRAHDLYRAVLEPAAAELEGVEHLLVVPDGPLESLPPGLLVTAPPPERLRGYADLGGLAWLARRYAITVLPSVPALESLRTVAGTSRAERPFVGFGDPALGGTVTVDARGAGDALAGLAPLPETREELSAMAAYLGAPASDLYLAERAGEPEVRGAELARYRVIAFATHALGASELPELGEPALVLSRLVGGSDDASADGLLAAGEIAGLELDADWVILSACNTAARDADPRSGRFSGLPSAFLYAGSRSLLVSHWEVSSQATVALMKAVFAGLSKGGGKAAAVRAARLRLMEGRDRPEFAHPYYWAAFELIGGA